MGVLNFQHRVVGGGFWKLECLHPPPPSQGALEPRSTIEDKNITLIIQNSIHHVILHVYYMKFAGPLASGVADHQLQSSSPSSPVVLAS